jgi:hypothetical protein
MTSVFSGGLVYEYSEEGNGYGIVNIQGNSVHPISQQFNDLEQALSSTQSPSGDGGYSAHNPVQECPGQNKDWDTKPFTGDALPSQPSGVSTYFQNGAGKGPGLNGPGSQEAGTGNVGTASASAGAVTQTYGHGSSPSSSGSAANSLYSYHMDMAPLAVSAFVVLFSFGFGAYIL